MKAKASVIVWFRRDLRLADNLAWDAAICSGYNIIPLFIYEDSDYGAAAKLWLEKSLCSLDRSLIDIGSKLVIREGAPRDILQEIILEQNVLTLFCNRRFEPELQAVDQAIFDSLAIAVEQYSSNNLLDYSKIFNNSGTSYKVFTPFYKNALKILPESALLPRLKTSIINSANDVFSLQVSDLQLSDVAVDWMNKLISYIQAGEQSAYQQLQKFKKIVSDYDTARGVPSILGTSKLSCHLAFGEISPWRIWSELQGQESFLRQLIWREFAYYIMFHCPHSVKANYNSKFDKFPWINNRTQLKLWQQGLTGYPIVDAGMRELWSTGWMHNRVRMIVASFLVKDLLIDWQEGAKWFMDTLFDADLANNTMGWQWVAGSGVDASPFFRIFNPITQGKKFDPRAEYLRKWLPELAKLDDKWIQIPFEAPEQVLKAANIKLGIDYPEPIVNHHEARQRALEILKAL